MDAIERDNPSLKDVLPKVFARGNLTPPILGKLIDEIGNVSLKQGNGKGDFLGKYSSISLVSLLLLKEKKVVNSIHHEA